MPRNNSIFDDQDFLNTIESIFEKKAQNANSLENYKLALRMVDNLAQQDPSPAIRPTADPQSAQPAQSDLYSLDAFIGYLAKNNFKSTGGLAIVAPTTEDTQVAQGYLKYVSKSPSGMFQVNKDGIISALKYFYSKAHSTDNLYLQELVSKLIDDAQVDKQLNLGEGDLSSDELNKSKNIDDFSSLPDNTALDQISSKVNLKQNMYPDEAGIITAADLRDDNVGNFIRRFSISVDGSDKYIPLDYSKDNAQDNPVCYFLNYLHERAAKLPNTEIKNKYYSSQLEKFLGQKHCAVGDQHIENTDGSAGTKEDKYRGNQSNPKADQVAYKEVSDALQEGGGSSSLLFPFDLNTDMINFDRFKKFLGQADELISKPSFVSEMSSYIASLRASIVAAQRAIINWEGIATPSAMEGGFALSVNQDLRSFVETFAGSDQNPYSKARDMLNTMIPICLTLANVVRILSASPTLKSLGEDIFREQYQKGLDYKDVANSLISQINSIARYSK